MTTARKQNSFVVAQHAAPFLGTIFKTWALLMPAAALLACALAAPSVLGDCKCHPAEKDDVTRKGANEFVLDVPKETYRKVQGTVVGMSDDRPMENALVEIFDHPDYLLRENPLAEHPQQRRVAACVTGTNGRFCFHTLPPGKYELRSSLESGWNITHIYVVVDKKGQRKKIQVMMHIGT
jgi:protocatechuate 3,4-dioxygenase beta subunit